VRLFGLGRLPGADARLPNQDVLRLLGLGHALLQFLRPPQVHVPQGAVDFTIRQARRLQAPPPERIEPRSALAAPPWRFGHQWGVPATLRNLRPAARTG